MAEGGDIADVAAQSAHAATIAAEFDAWAPTYESGRLGPWYQMHAREVLEHLDMTKARRILDIGCGTGWALRQLAKRYPEVEYHGLDLSAEMIAEARLLAQAEGLNITFHHADWEQSGASDIASDTGSGEQRFDLVLALSSLHYMSDLQEALASIRDSLYAGGKLVLVERATQGSTLTSIWGALHKFVLKDGVEFADTEELLRMMRSVGFAAVRTLAEKRHMLRYGKLFTSIAVIEGAVSDGNA